MNRETMIRTLAVLLTLAVLSAGRAPADGAEGEGLTARVLDRTQGTLADERPAFLARLGAVEEGWLQDLARGAEALTAREGAVVAPELQESLLYQVRLTRLLDVDSAVDPLRRLAATPWVPEGLAYEAMMSLDELGGSADLLLGLARDAEPRRARLAVLALALNRRPPVVRALETVREERSHEADLGAAFQFVDLYRHDLRLYSSLAGDPARRLAFLEERLRRAYNPINGITQTWDPYSAGHPVSRWAMDEWRAATLEAPGLAAGLIAGLSGYPAPGIEDGYRAFLTDLAAPSARRLGPGRQP